MESTAVVFEIWPALGLSEPVSALTHFAVVVLALVFAPRLWRATRGLGWARAGIVLYIFGVVNLFAMSGTFHLLEPGTAGRDVLQRLDHAGIWVLIAGTFTGMHAVAFRGIWRWGILLLVWTAAISGLVLKTVFFHTLPEWAGLTFYLALGWVGVATAFALRRHYGRRVLLLLIGGGVAYSVGAVLEFAQAPVLISHVFGPHEIFHVAVIAGAGLHWLLIEALAKDSALRTSGPCPQSYGRHAISASGQMS